jgi:hypothetical protein
MPSRPRRAFRFLGYALVAFCGVAAILWPPQSVSHAATSPLVYVWITFLIVGGLACAAGAAWDAWLGEYIGLWPLITAFAVFAVSALATGRLVAASGGACLLAIACWLVARWQEVAVLRREATRQQQAGR